MGEQGWRDDLWLVTRHDEVLEATRDVDSFSSAHDMPNGATSATGVMVPPLPIRAIPLELDPPDHKIIRDLLAPRFSAEAIVQRIPDIRAFTDSAIDQRREVGILDLWNDIARIAPTMAIMDVLGLPVEDAAAMTDFCLADNQEFRLTGATAPIMRGTMHAIMQRRRTARDDLLSDLLTAKIAGSSVSEFTMIELVLTIAAIGVATTAGVTLALLTQLARDADSRARIVCDRSILPSAVEEMLRVASPARIIARTVTREVSIGQASLSAGQRVGLALALANRDPKVFERPHDIVLTRDPNPHVALGHGIHECVGAHLARTIVGVVVDRVLESIPEYELADELTASIEELSIHPQPVRVRFTACVPPNDS